MITIVDYKTGNVGSIKNIIEKIGYECRVTNNLELIKNSDKIIIAGVGSFDMGMKQINDLELREVLNKFALEDKRPVLGICLGMQLMAMSSDEGLTNGLGWLPLKVSSLSTEPQFKGTVPIMGWNYIQVHKENILVNEPLQKFYFVHSYYVPQNEFSILDSRIGEFVYCAAFQKENIFGVQFHPEKSNKYGQRLLLNFCSI